MSHEFDAGSRLPVSSESTPARPFWRQVAMYSGYWSPAASLRRHFDEVIKRPTPQRSTTIESHPRRNRNETLTGSASDSGDSRDDERRGSRSYLHRQR